MDSLEMLMKIKHKDPGAFDELMNRYGMSVYSRLLTKLGDKNLVDEAFKKTMLEFYDFIEQLEGEDIVEAMLFARADQVQKCMMDEALNELYHEMQEKLAGDGAEKLPEPEEKPEPVFTVPTEEKPEPAAGQHQPKLPAAKPEETIKFYSNPAAVPAETKPEEKEKKPQEKDNKLGTAGVILLVVLILLLAMAAWFGLGVSMVAGLVPPLDMGYSWFNLNVFPLFTVETLFPMI